MEKKKSLIIRILIPVLIVLVIFAIWIIKGGDKENKNNNIKNKDFSLNITTKVDFEELKAYEIPIIVDYGSDSCIPCKQMAPALKKVNKDMEGKAFIKFVDVWKYSSATGNVPIQVIPTQVIFNADGTPFIPSDKLSDEIEFLTHTDKISGKHTFTTHQGSLTEEQMKKILKEMGVE